MIREELVKRSPFRILEKSIRGGAGKGNIGVIAACKGVGKTACLVHLATDKLFQGKHVLHVSFSPNTNHIVSWYEDIFEEIAKRNNLESAMDIHDEIIRHRIILNFKQDGISALQIKNSLLSIINGAGFNADLVVVDGYDFSISANDEFTVFKKLAEELAIEIWFTATLKREETSFDHTSIPKTLEPFRDAFSILILLESSQGYVHLNLLKDHDSIPGNNLHLKLDPQILLIADEK